MSRTDNELAKIVAVIFFLILLFLNGAATMWFVFGLWPKSWWAYIGFTLVTVVLTVLMKAVE